MTTVPEPNNQNPEGLGDSATDHSVSVDTHNQSAAAAPRPAQDAPCKESKRTSLNSLQQLEEKLNILMDDGLSEEEASAAVASSSLPVACLRDLLPESDWHPLVEMVFQNTDSAVVVQKSGICVYANQPAQQLLQQRYTQLVGTDVLTDILADSDSYIGGGAQGAKWLLERSAEAGHCRTEISQLDAEGVEKHLEVLLQSSSIDQDFFTVAFIKDITKQKSLEKQLRSGRDFHNKLINSIPECFFVTDSEHRIVLCNDAFCRMLHKEREWLLGKDVFALFPKEAADHLASRGDTLLQFNLCENSEMNLLGDGLSERVFSVRRSVFEDRESGQRFVVSSAEDVTVARHDQVQLKLLASVYRNAGEGIAILNKAGMFCEVNPAFVQLTGYDTLELMGEPLVCVFDQNAPGMNAENYMTQICSHPEWNDTMIIQSKRGETVHSWVSVNHVLDGHGNLSHMIAIFSDMSEIHATQERLRYQAFHDPLTLLPSRAYFHERLREMLDSQTDQPQPFAVLFMDLDNFKNVNDTMGHNMGDDLLKQVASRLKTCLSETCFVGRFGGDEFAVLIPDIYSPENDPLATARRIISEIERPFDIAGHKFFIGTSIGICQYPEHGQDMESLLRNSDTAMYRAKAAGKNQLRVYSHELSSQVRRRMTLASELREAVDKEAFQLVYQPKVELKTNLVRSCESLIRWQAPDGKFIPPSEFIPIAEENGLIENIGEFVIHESCRTLKRWDSIGLGIDRIAINLSPRQFNHRFPETVMNILRDHAVLPSQIEFEITETIMMEDAQKTAAIIRSLSEQGFHFSIDDFGTGHSSLGYLKSFQVDCLKIDRTFIRDLPDDDDALAIVQSILTLARSRRLPVVAEGVETYQQLELLKDEGCDYIQGYYYSKPLPTEEFEQFVNTFNAR